MITAITWKQISHCRDFNAHLYSKSKQVHYPTIINTQVE